MFDSLLTPTILLDLDVMERNIALMQQRCNECGVDLRPHIKTHKMVEAAKRQLAAGAAGLVCAKISEAEKMLAANPPSIFIAHSIVDVRNAPRLKKLSEAVPELIVGCTSELHAVALEAVLAAADLTLPVMLAVDTGLGREGVRDVESAVNLAALIEQQPHLTLHGMYTHEGQMYAKTPEESDIAVQEVHHRLLEMRDAVTEKLGLDSLRLWPGCSASAWRMAALPDVDAVRPGAYIFGDLALCETTAVMPEENCAISILATVIDRPQLGLALVDAGSKVFSSDKTPQGISGRVMDGRDLKVVRCNEEHGYVQGDDVDQLAIGQRLRFVPAHICAVINLTDSVTVVRGDEVLAVWKVDARGCVQ